MCFISTTSPNAPPHAPSPILFDQSLKRHMELVSTHTVDLFKIPKVNQRERERERDFYSHVFPNPVRYINYTRRLLPWETSPPT